MKKHNKIKYIQVNFEQAMEAWYVQDSKENRLELFNVFNRLVIEVLSSEFNIVGERNYNYSFHYSLDLLDKFLSNSEYKRGFTGREITEYIKTSIINYLQEGRSQVEPEIFEGLEEFNKQVVPDNQMLNYEIFNEINDLLDIFFTRDEVKRYLPLAINVISTGNHSKIVTLRDENFKYFCMLLISLGKKLSRYYEKDLSIGNHKVNEITMLIASTNSSVIPRELVLALDLASLDRLVDFAGGEVITVPTKDELQDAYNEISESFRYPSIQAKVEPLERDIGITENVPAIDSTYKLFCGWLKDNKKELSQDKLDNLLKILSE